MRKSIIIFVIPAFIVVSCIPLTKYKEVDKQRTSCQKDNETLKSQDEQLTVENTESKRRLSFLEKQNQELIKDSVDNSYKTASIKKENDRVNQMYNELQKSQENLLKGNAKETQRLMMQLQETQENLQKKEDALKSMETSLNEKKVSLDNLTLELEKRDARMKEMESVLNKKDSIVKALKNKVSEALLGFENQGLTIKVKNGKVYVSLDEKLLFKSGSYDIDSKGEDALKKLAKVLEQNTDINVMIEGHTDDVPYRGKAQIRDNWDLSVMRATSVVKILLHGTTIDPKRFTSAGRSEYLPIDDSKTQEARQKNRRTEIILTPKLDELFKILDNN